MNILWDDFIDPRFALKNLIKPYTKGLLKRAYIEINKSRPQSHGSTCLRINIINMYKDGTVWYKQCPVWSDLKVSGDISSAHPSKPLVCQNYDNWETNLKFNK